MEGDRMAGKRTLLLLAAAVCLVLAGCTISTHKENGKNGEDKDVDIRTPLGSLSVRKGSADAKETGLAVYPGAQPRADSDDNDSSANVNISSSLFGLKVVALKFSSSDSPEKVLAFYRKEMGRYGKVLECAGGFNMAFHHHDKDAEVTCDGHSGSDHEYKEELKVGTENNQRIVAVKPSGKGSEFALVYVRAHDAKDTM
jgi:hypothetical protein